MIYDITGCFEKFQHCPMGPSLHLLHDDIVEFSLHLPHRGVPWIAVSNNVESC